ncbi:MAG: SGNH/GDSL hydrolase family protein [Desulforhopalus sp.]
MSRPLNTTNITAFGDSITEGLYSRSGGYPPKLNELLSSNGTPIIVTNTGISGEKTPEGAARLNDVLSDFPANIVLIMEGTNDVLRGLSVETTQINLQKMIDIAKSNGAIPILATLPPSSRPDISTLIPNVWNPMIVSLAQSNGIKLADHYSAILPTWTSSTIDGLHPNDIGHYTIAKTWYSAIREMISAKAKTSLENILFKHETLSNLVGLPPIVLPLESAYARFKDFRSSLLLTFSPPPLLVNTYNHYFSLVAEFLGQHEEARAGAITVLYLTKTFISPLVVLSYLVLRLGFPLQMILCAVITAGMVLSARHARKQYLSYPPPVKGSSADL